MRGRAARVTTAVTIKRRGSGDDASGGIMRGKKKERGKGHDKGERGMMNKTVGTL